MIFYYLILGILMSIFGAVPLGTVNLAVIRTSMRETTKNTLQLILAAGFGEVILTITVLKTSMEISSFVENNPWINVAILLLFLFIGFYLLISKQKGKTQYVNSSQKSGISKYLTGFLLAILNPPVIIYWIAAITIINTYLTQLTLDTSLLLLFLFFAGIYIGKTITLYFYSIWGNKIAQKPRESNQKTIRIIGSIFILLSIFQGIKLSLF